MNDKRIEDILFYSVTNIKPSKKGLERILDNLPVTNYRQPRYSNIMGFKFAIPIGILIFLIMLFVGTGKRSQPQTVTVLPATVTKENVNDSLNKIDASVSTTIDEMDNDLEDLDKSSSDGKIDQEGNESADLEDSNEIEKE